jgi:hypothetical protein
LCELQVQRYENYADIAIPITNPKFKIRAKAQPSSAQLNPKSEIRNSNRAEGELSEDKSKIMNKISVNFANPLRLCVEY